MPGAQQHGFRGRAEMPTDGYGNPVNPGPAPMFRQQFGHQMGGQMAGHSMFGKGHYGQQPAISNRLQRGAKGGGQLHPVDLWHWPDHQSDSDVMSAQGGFGRSAAGSTDQWLMGQFDESYDG